MYDSGIAAVADTASQENDRYTQIIDNIVCSWIFSVSQQILAETATKALAVTFPSTDEMQGSSTKMSMYRDKGQEPKTIIQDPKTTMYPPRRSSLAPNPTPRTETSSASISNSGIGPSWETAKSDVQRTGVEQLAYFRAELYLLKRGALKRLGILRSWFADLGALDIDGPGNHGAFEDVSLEDGNEPPDEGRARGDAKTALQHYDTAGIENQLLCSALESTDKFYRLYEVCISPAAVFVRIMTSILRF